MSNEHRILLAAAAFTDSPQALSITAAPTADIRTIAQRFLTACYDDLGKVPRLLDGDEMAALLREILPRQFGVRDPLASAVEEVLAAYLAHLGDTEVVPAAYELRRALDENAAAFRAAVAAGDAHRDGVVRGKGKTVAHRAAKVSRNDPCPCGSGRKFKKCCMGLGGMP